MFLKKPKYRRFEYLPRFYNPEKDHAQEFKQNLERQRRSVKRKKRPALVWGILLALLIYVYLTLSGVFR